jgi:hypothetical protein
MAKLSRQTGTTSHILQVFIGNTSSSTGAGLTGLLFNTSGLTCYYKRNTGTASVSVTLVTITTLGTYVSGGFKEIDPTNMTGWYEFHPPDAAYAASASSVGFHLQGAANMAPLPIEVELTANNNQDGVRSGNTALPNAAAGAAGGLPTVDSTNSVKIQGPPKRNTAFANFEFLMRGLSGDPTAGLTPITAQRSIDGAAFGSCANSVTEISNGSYKINLDASDVNGVVIMLRFSATGAKDTFITLLTLP